MIIGDSQSEAAHANPWIAISDNELLLQKITAKLDVAKLTKFWLKSFHFNNWGFDASNIRNNPINIQRNLISLILLNRLRF